MGAQNVQVLEGGFDRWKEAGFPVETGTPNPPLARIFNADFNASMLANKNELEQNINSKRAVVIDARPNARFKGEAAEPRAGLRSGHIPGSSSLPFDTLLENGTLKQLTKLQEALVSAGVTGSSHVITSCGSGVTAAVLTLALEESGHTDHKLYDGSWAEWGMPDGPPVETG